MSLSFYERKHGWTTAVYNGVSVDFPADGLVIRFRYEDVSAILSAYPGRSEKGPWYFNETLDREIAERRGNEVIANPQLLWRHFPDSTK